MGSPKPQGGKQTRPRDENLYFPGAHPHVPTSPRPQRGRRWPAASGGAPRSSVDHLVHGGLLVPRAGHDVLVVPGDVTAQHGGRLLGLETGEGRVRWPPGHRGHPGHLGPAGRDILAGKGTAGFLERCGPRPRMAGSSDGPRAATLVFTPIPPRGFARGGAVTSLGLCPDAAQGETLHALGLSPAGQACALGKGRAQPLCSPQEKRNGSAALSWEAQRGCAGACTQLSRGPRLPAQ